MICRMPPRIYPLSRAKCNLCQKSGAFVCGLVETTEGTADNNSHKIDSGKNPKPHCLLKFENGAMADDVIKVPAF